MRIWQLRFRHIAVLCTQTRRDTGALARRLVAEEVIRAYPGSIRY